MTDSLEFQTAWPYAAALESTDCVQLQPRYDLFIGGAFRAPAAGGYFPTVNPANERLLAHAATAEAADIDAAVAAARAVHRSWQLAAPASAAATTQLAHWHCAGGAWAGDGWPPTQVIDPRMRWQGLAAPRCSPQTAPAPGDPAVETDPASAPRA